MSWITQTSRGVVLNIHATPRASRSGIQGLHGDALKVRLQAPPVDGKANAALIACLAEVFGIPERNITILSGDTGRRKRVLLEGLDVATASSLAGNPASGKG